VESFKCCSTNMCRVSGTSQASGRSVAKVWLSLRISMPKAITVIRKKREWNKSLCWNEWCCSGLVLKSEPSSGLSSMSDKGA